MKVEFFNYQLTANDKKAVKANLVPPTKLDDTLTQFADDGYKFGLSYSPKTEAYWVSLTGKTKGMGNYAKCLSIPHNDLMVAVSAHVYLLDIIGADGDWSDLEQEAGGQHGW